MGTGIKKLKLHTLAVLILFLVVAPSMFAEPETVLFAQEKNNIKIEFFPIDSGKDPVAKILSLNPYFKFNFKQAITSLAIHPVRLSVTNNGNFPIEISARSLKTKLASDEAISRLTTSYEKRTGITLSPLCMSLYGGFFLCTFEGGFNNGIASFRGFTKCWRSLICNPLLLSSIIFLLYKVANGEESIAAKRIKQFTLNEPIFIEPGNTVTKVIFFNTSTYSPFFDFFVLNPVDKNSYAAIFNVALN